MDVYNCICLFLETFACSLKVGYGYVTEYAKRVRQEYGVGAPIKRRTPCLREMP